MSRNGSGTQTSPGSSFPAVANTLIESAKFNNIINDINASITASIANDGQTPILANLPMNGFKHTGAAAASASGQYVEYAQNAALLAAKADSSALAAKANAGANTDITSLASPALAGATATTQSAGNNTTKVATTAFVATSFAPLASPALTGNPTAPTAAATDDDASIATTAFVNSSGWFESTEQIISLSDFPIAHSLGRSPKQFMAVIRCKTAEFGYSIGDEVANFVINSGAGYYIPSSVYANSTIVGCWLNAQIAVITRAGAYGNITNSNWRLVLRCR